MIRLLIADDEIIERAVLVKTLKKHLGEPCEIFQAENGREALNIYREKKIQIAILDIEMPGIDGIQAAEAIRETDKQCCIIFLTAFDEFAYAKKAITVRALDYLLKPYEENELLLVVEEAIQLVKEREQQAQAARPDALAGGKVHAEKSGVDEVQGDAGQGNTRVMERIMDYIQEHYMYELSMQELAKHMNYSEAYFCKLFKQCFNQNFTTYLTEYRVNAAKKLLEEPTVNVKEIGKAVGYGDANYFAKVFKRITGLSPTEYRAELFRE